MMKAVQYKLKMGYSPEDLYKVIDNYARLVESDRAPGYGEWGLGELMRNIAYFDMLLDDKWEGFRRQRREKPHWYAEEPVWDSREG